MKLVIQRVQKAIVRVEDEIVGNIDKGLLVFLGVSNEDDGDIVKKYVDKLVKLRIFEDGEGKTNLSIQDVGGKILVVSQFTLYADCKKGNRPSFINAGKPNVAEALYELFLDEVADRMGTVERGIFGADMKVELINDGPFTILLDESIL